MTDLKSVNAHGRALTLYRKATEKTGNGTAGKTTVALTGQGRKALDDYTQALRGLLDGL
jgi:hypothetical protein